MNNLSAAIYMTAQGIPFLQAGEEMLRAKIDASGDFVETATIPRILSTVSNGIR